MSLTPAGWFAVRVPPHHIKLCVDPGYPARGEQYFPAERMMTRLRLEVFIPTMQLWRRENKYAKEKRLITFPLLAPYVFVLVSDDEDWFRLWDLNYGQAVVGVAERPFRIGDKEMDRMRKEHEKGQYRAPEEQKFMRTHGEYSEGDEVFLEQGAYAGHRVKVHKISVKKRRAEIMLTLFGAERPAEIPLADLVRKK